MLCLFISPTPTSTNNQSLILKKSWLKWKMSHIFYHNKNISSKKVIFKYTTHTFLYDTEFCVLTSGGVPQSALRLGLLKGRAYLHLQTSGNASFSDFSFESWGSSKRCRSNSLSPFLDHTVAHSLGPTSLLTHYQLGSSATPCLFAKSQGLPSIPGVH